MGIPIDVDEHGDGHSGVDRIFTDHLGAGSAPLDGSGTVLAGQRYCAFGATRLIAEGP